MEQVVEKAGMQALEPGFYGSQEQMAALFGAISAMQQKVGDATIDSKGQVGTQKTKYASLTSVLGEVRPHLQEHGLALMQFSATRGTGAQTMHFLMSTLTHKEGGYLVCETPLVIAGSGMQAYGSAVTYARRYMVKSLFLMADEDDDGDAASNPSAKTASAASHAAAKPVASALPAKPVLIDDPVNPAVAESIKKIAAKKTLAELARAKQFAPTTYAGAALQAVMDAFAVAEQNMGVNPASAV